MKDKGWNHERRFARDHVPSAPSPCPNRRRSSRGHCLRRTRLLTAACSIGLAAAAAAARAAPDVPPASNNSGVKSSATPTSASAQKAPAGASSPNSSGASTPASPATASTARANTPPHQLVDEGNRLFDQGDIAAAIDKYRQALPARPDSQELAFDMGLAQLKLGDYDAARESLRSAALSPKPELADNARFALGLCDHAEALSMAQTNPSGALDHAQNAIRQYHDVLTHDPQHAAARDAWHKGAAFWRQLSQQMQQQPQQGSPSQDDQKQSDSEDQKQEQDQQSQSKSQQQQNQDPQQRKDTQQDSQQPSQQDPSQNGDSQPSDSESEQNQRNEAQSSKDDASAERQQSQQNANDASQQQKESDPAQSKQTNDQDQKKQAAQQQQNDNKEETRKDAEQVDAAAERDKKDSSDTLDRATRELRRLMDRQRVHERSRQAPRVRPSAPPAGKDW